MDWALADRGWSLHPIGANFSHSRAGVDAGGTRATAINYVQVVFAALWGLLFLGESINELMVMGAVLVLGATLISIKPPRTPQPLH